MQCPHCQRELEAASTECPYCGIVLAKYRGFRPVIPHANRAGVGTGPPPSTTPPRTTRGTHWIVPVLLVLSIFVAGALGALWRHWHPWTFPAVTLPTASGAAVAEPCQGRTRCLVVYVTPWCGACKVAVPVIQQIRRRWDRQPAAPGLKVIVGQDTPRNLQAMASRIGGDVFLDADRALWQQLGGGSVPHWFVLDPQGRVLTEYGGTYDDATPQLRALGLAP